MSKNAKNARRIKEARERKGVKGPAATKCLNPKPKAWFRVGNNNNGKRAPAKAVDVQAQAE